MYINCSLTWLNSLARIDRGMSNKYTKINIFNLKENNIVNKEINKVTYKNKKLKTGKKCARCGWWIESGEIATQWNRINIYTHANINCNSTF